MLSHVRSTQPASPSPKSFIRNTCELLSRFGRNQPKSSFGNSYRINTCRPCTRNSFTIRTYKKVGRGLPPDAPLHRSILPPKDHLYPLSSQHIANTFRHHRGYTPRALRTFTRSNVPNVPTFRYTVSADFIQGSLSLP